MFEWLKNLKIRRNARPAPRRGRRFYGATTNNLYYSWQPANQTLDAELFRDLEKMRARSRELSLNNPYCKRFLDLCKVNIVGKTGLKFQSGALNKKDEPDAGARKFIETLYGEYCLKGNCDVTGRYSMKDVENMIIETTARDGEVLIWKHSGFNNKFNFSLQLLEADHLDIAYSDTAANGNVIKMGIEFDEYSRPVAYHLFVNHPGDYAFGLKRDRERIRVPAEEIIHFYLHGRVSQSRGYPWIHSIMNALNQLGGYYESELVASRASAAKMGFYKKPEGDDYKGDDTQKGAPIQNAEPGVFEILEPGWDFISHDPNHPTTAFESFVKGVLMSVSSGLNVSYHKLTGDLERVNYSSARAGELTDRDQWRALQTFLAEHFSNEVFKSWLPLQFLNNNIPFPISRLDKYLKAHWQPRGWSWVDPEKDSKAKRSDIANGFDTASNVAAENGRDLEEIYKQLAQEAKWREKYKVPVDYDITREF